MTLPDPSALRKIAEAATFQHRTVYVEAFQLTQDLANAHILDKATLPFGVKASSSNFHPKLREVYSFHFAVKQPSGWAFPKVGDWIIKSSDGVLHVCSRETFEADYEPQPTIQATEECDALKAVVEELAGAAQVLADRFGKQLEVSGKYIPTHVYERHELAIKDVRTALQATKERMK